MKKSGEILLLKIDESKFAIYKCTLRDDSNPFAVVVLTTLLAIKNKKVSDEKLKDIKLGLYDEMMKREMDKKTRQGLYNFLTYYVRFNNQENFIIFEQEIEKKLGRNSIMGTHEYLLDKAEKEGIAKGRLEERAKLKVEKQKAEHEKAISVALEFKKMGLPIADIAKGTGLSIEEVEKL
ncbi:hypothetical protein [Sphingobacterium sp. JUb21]|uniref:hypothetical protein n=1 Tax=Sphingobacterium sp. JUb21 TaxID=2940616 RepID=UPI00105269EE|nr:hypothetical protein [Sphingobacterium sp. JUb21]MCS3553583.1 putative transposase YdaD [Sphingobacterium sp. JUb21]